MVRDLAAKKMQRATALIRTAVRVERNQSGTWFLVLSIGASGGSLNAILSERRTRQKRERIFWWAY